MHEPAATLKNIVRGHLDKMSHWPSDDNEVAEACAAIVATLNRDLVLLAAQTGIRRVVADINGADRQRNSVTEHYDSTTDPRILARTDYAQSHVTIPSTGERVRFCDLTVDQHRERIAHMHQRVQGIQETIDRHLRAIQEIQKAGARTLSDLEVGVAV